MILLSDIFPTDRIICLKCPAYSLGFPGGSDSKESTRSAEDLGSIPGLGRSPGGRHGNPPQYACLENPMDRGAWRAVAMVLQRVGHDWATERRQHIVRTLERLSLIIYYFIIIQQTYMGLPTLH